MERFVTYIRQLEASDLPDAPPSQDVYLSTSTHELVETLTYLATNLFIGVEGTPLFQEMDVLSHEYGYVIFPGERDRFGWVTACLQTKKGIIVFG